MEIGDYRESTNLEDTYEDFLVELDFEYNLIQVYFADLFNFSKDKKEKIKTKFSQEDFQVVSSLSKQPNYLLYENKFNDLLAKSIIVTLLSNFEFNLIKLIELLIKDGYIKNVNFKKPQTGGVIYYCLNFLSKNTQIQQDFIDYKNFEIFIKIRNSIIHNNSEINNEILNHVNYTFYKDFIIIKNQYFFFNDIIINYHLTKTIRTFFNSISGYIK
jgi:hypothetical protein